MCNYKNLKTNQETHFDLLSNRALWSVTSMQCNAMQCNKHIIKFYSMPKTRRTPCEVRVSLIINMYKFI